MATLGATLVLGGFRLAEDGVYEQGLAGLGVPEPQRALCARRKQAPAIGGEGAGVERVRMPAEQLKRRMGRGGGRKPDFQRLGRARCWG